MTIVNIDVKDLGGVAHPADRIVFRAPTHRADGDRVVSTAAHTVMLDAGVGSADLVPGPAVVKIHCEGVTDTGEKQILVPEDGPVELADLLEASYVYSPAVVSQVAGLVSDAELAAAAAWEAVDTPGRQGPPGVAVSIVSQVTLPDNSVQVTFSDDSVLTVPAGLQGLRGEPGAPGADGVDGVDGLDGDLSPEDRALVVAATGHAADAAQSAADALVSAGMAEDRAQAAAQSAADAAESVTSGLADGSVTRVKLAADVTGELDGKAPVVHEHTMAQISDLPEVSVLPTGGTLVKRGVSGGMLVPITPADPADATSKSYVDAAVADAAGAVSSVNELTGDVVLDAGSVGAAPAVHGHVIAEITGLPAALESIEDRPTVSTVSGMIEGAVDALVGSAPEALDTLYEIAAKLGDQDDAVAALVSAIAGKADSAHTHTVSQISDLPAVTQLATAGALVQRRGNSQITVPEVPADASDAVAKSYVDSRIQLVETLPTTGAPGVLYVIAEA